MATKEIKSDNWSRFFQIFSEKEQDTLITIDQIDQAGISRCIARQAPLSSIGFDQKAACNNVIRIRTSGTNPVLHQIIEPIHVKIRQDSNDHKILQIDAEMGATTIGFHSGRLEEMLRLLEQSATLR